MKKDVLQMPEMWLSKERLLSNSTPRFLTDDGESTEQPSSVIMWVLGPIINTCFFLNLAVRNYLSSTFLYQLCILCNYASFSIWCVSLGREEI